MGRCFSSFSHCLDVSEKVTLLSLVYSRIWLPWLLSQWLEPHGHHCYYWNSQACSWSQAEEVCIASGGNLASIANRQTDAFLKAKGNEDFWIGGIDQGDEGKWRWTDGSSWVFTHWASGEPSGASRWLGLAIGKKEDCLMMDFSKGAWNDNACSVLQLPLFCSQPICFGKFS